MSRQDQTAPEFKAACDQVAVMLPGNANRDCKQKPVVPFHAENLRALKGFHRSSLPVYWWCMKKD
jgi:hypothetical protein